MSKLEAGARSFIIIIITATIMLMSCCLDHWSVSFPLQDLMPIHCCAMQGRIDAIQALLFFDTAGSIKQSLEMEDEVLETSIFISEKLQVLKFVWHSETLQVIKSVWHSLLCTRVK